jgi:hypothetical protein
MLAQGSDLAIIIPAFLGIVTVVVGFGKMLTAHVGDNDKHPNCEDIVFRDVCAKAHESIQAQFELMEKHNRERHEDLKCYLEKWLKGDGGGKVE